MNNTWLLIIGLCAPFLATSLGAATVLFFKKINSKIEKIALGISGGIMLSASFLSLIFPSMELCEQQNKPAYIYVTVGLFLFLTDVLLAKKAGKQNKFMLVTAITLHNFPEGMIIGLSLGLAIFSPSIVSSASALTLALGIAIQNIPEGSAVSMPLMAKGTSKKKAFWIGVLSGIVEPIGSVLAILLVEFVSSILPFLLCFSAGTMLFVTTKELIPESQQSDQPVGLISFFAGFLLMLVLDIALG